MANGKAGNYKISCDDTEFSKFVFCLKKVLFELCRRLTADCDKQGRVFWCKVSGAKSQQVAKSVAKALVSSSGIRRMLSKGENDVERLMNIVCCAADLVDFTKLQITLEGGDDSFVLYEDSTFMRIEKAHLLKMVDWQEVTLKIALNEGNYSATALGCIEEKDILS
jgi:glutamate N-acetyltransferase/amino-acid N-acetyltransferase